MILSFGVSPDSARLTATITHMNASLQLLALQHRRQARD
jgi:hypothetical protein